MSIIAIFVVLLLTVSANTGRSFSAVEGTRAADFKVTDTDADSTVSLSDLKGRYVLLNFWSSDDAASRIAAQQYNRLLANVPEEQICQLAVNFDRSERLFREIVRIDNLKATSQFFVEAQTASDLIDRYDMSHGLQSFLIDPQGTIVAINPSAQTIHTLVGV